LGNLFHLGKRAQASNYFSAIVFLVGFGLINFCAYVLLLGVIDSFVASGMYTGVMVSAGNSFLFAMSIFDYIMVAVTIIFIIGVAVTSFALAARPVFFFINFVMGIFYCVVSYFYNFIFSQIVSNAVFDAVIGFFPRTILILTNLHWVMLVMIIVGSITLFGKKPKGQFLS